MLSLFSVIEKKQDYVDLYYNDLVGLQKTTKTLLQRTVEPALVGSIHEALKSHSK